jgi:adenylate cyclase
MTTQEVKRKLIAILSADVKGYSRLMGEDEKGTVRTLNAYKEVMASLIQHHHGRVVDAPGDNVLAEFGSVVDAVECAVEIQKELKTRNAELPENRRMLFRIGVNLGDVIEDGEQILGNGVNIAARLENLSEAGGICISGTAFDHVRNKLSLGYDYLGEQTVKNIALPVRVYKVLMEPEAAGKVIGEKKAKPRQWQMTTIGLVIGVIMVVAAILIWKLYTPSAPQSEITLKQKVVASPPEKVPAVVSPSTEIAPKEQVTPPSPGKASKPTVPPAPKVEVASKERMAFPLPDKPSIAVLPFVNMSGDPKKDYLSDGITEEIINALSMIPTVFVIARNSTFTYKGKPVKVQQVSEEMGVQYVMEGSVQWSGDRVRITVQLIDALKGHHLFSERYDRELKDIFALQDEITKKALMAMRVALRGEDARVAEKETKNLDAYLKLLQAWEHIQVVNKDKVALARPLVEESLVLDPGNASAYAALANINILEVYVGASKSPRESLDRAEELAKKALALDNSHIYANTILSLTYVFKKQFDKAIPPAERAVALSPNSAWACFMLGTALFHSERFEDAIPYFKKSLRLSPIPIGQCLLNLAGAYRFLGRYDEAIANFKKLLQLQPDYLPAHASLAGVYILAGRQEEARAEAAEVMRIDPQFSLERYARALPLRQALVDQLVDAMRKAGLK